MQIKFWLRRAPDHADRRKDALLIFDYCRQSATDILRALSDRSLREAAKISERPCALIFDGEDHDLQFIDTIVLCRWAIYTDHESNAMADHATTLSSAIPSSAREWIDR
ncbi:hypothetical protein [Mesorhizobium qingshengii]|uniref:hypothetical protein n=1 Tax=Mesorhizobium qingshengii TaxID=1165689 RepID=UPI000B854D7A|nr:hypothetical protein [Mesorhizobium qingshengii]